jgi:hypothetical protein
MGLNIEENGMYKLMKEMAKEFRFGSMEVDMKVIGIKIKLMVKDV